ncbi:hematopoietic SH2 domain-containing protein homolog [Scomber japonicus]|uniref:hematopoietic SH2 domain-containing protein homolog n=1 Tax=Scomber japonicus TaxID=13676 RepID=UPI0023050D97|nr:hematopoietic SH2 domain-containing protein homolog [Scomber japonicus]
MMEWSQQSQVQHDAFTWFTGSQLGSVIRNGVVPEWFHGIISRKTAEELLVSKPPGYFLIRVSESRIGYTLSYRAADRCRHFMIDALKDGHYVIVGENRPHWSLQDVVDFHRRNPILPFTEVLTVACGQASNDSTDYAELLFPQRNRNPNTSLVTNNSLPPTKSNPVALEDTPPALPYRPNNPRNTSALSPSSQQNRLYPSLEDEFSNTTTPVPAMDIKPVPVARKRYNVTTDSVPLNQRPEVPARPSVPPPKQNQACIRTVSAPERPSTSTATDHPHGVNMLPARNQETKPSVVTNLKNLKKKFQKKRSMSQEYAEINMEAEQRMEAIDRSASTENEYQEITGQQTFDGAPFSYTCTGARKTDGRLPQEYLPPPPFAPGY